MAAGSLRGKRIQRDSMRAHRAHGAVDHVEEALAFVAEGLYELEIAHGEFVEAHETVGLDAAQGGDVVGLGMLGYVEIVEYGAGGNYGGVHFADSESFQVCRLEMSQEAFVGGVGCKYPVVKLEHKVASCEVGFGFGAVAAFDEQFFR